MLIAFDCTLSFITIYLLQLFILCDLSYSSIDSCEIRKHVFKVVGLTVHNQLNFSFINYFTLNLLHFVLWSKFLNNLNRGELLHHAVHLWKAIGKQHS